MSPFCKSLLFSLVTMVAACGDDGGTAPVDAPRDMGVDVPASPIVGTWQREPLTDEGTRIAAFNANGTFTDGPFSGTWQIMNDTIVFMLPPPIGRSVSEFYLSADHDTLLINAFRPEGTVSGVVGTWKNTTVYGTTTTLEIHELRADNSSTSTFQPGSTPMIHEGTWALAGGKVNITWNDTGDTLTLHAIEDVAIGSDLYHRL